MGKGKNSMSVAKGSDDAAKAKMLEALAKKQKNGSKIGAGQTGGAAPKMHRRKSGSA
jgi:hypothetical protein